MEAALAHMVENKAEAAYARNDPIERQGTHDAHLSMSLKDCVFQLQATLTAPLAMRRLTTALLRGSVS